jgi:hypothetical protein
MTEQEDPGDAAQDAAQDDAQEDPGGFQAADGGGVVGRFAAAEATLLRGLAGQVADLLEDEGSGGSRPVGVSAEFAEVLGLSENSELPDDPALARLLPDAYRGDQDASAEFRRYTERGLRSAKVAAAQTVLDTLPEDGGEVHLSADQAEAYLRSINDVRLALGVRLNVTEDAEEMYQRAEEGAPDAAALWIYDWLSYLLDTLVDALSLEFGGLQVRSGPC